MGSLPVAAQVASTLSGVVSEKDSGRPVQGARITVVGGKANTEVTDSEGSFVLTFAPEVKPGSTVRIHIEKQGYKPYDKLVPVSSAIALHILVQPVGPRYKEPPPEFKVDVIQSVTSSVMQFWVAAGRFKRIYPIDIFLDMRIVNLHNVTRSIDSFGIEAKTPSSSNWVPLTMITVEGNYHLYSGPLNAAFPSKVEPPIWNEALKEEIPPGRTVRLTGFFQVPTNSGLRSGMPSYRMTLRDTVGGIHVIEAQTPTATTKAGLNLEESIVQLTGGPVDLSNFQIDRP
jgi:hypothetical protein